ncbi:hypothetical protein EBB79_23625 (plasmid) [Parasedimentitalea marina]|uniref:Hedgehog/Intein (Hint) domain-containing protein n=1 Tax=Parasedimentitalea marina TaxID=2483033 RepID=A0A3T0NA48_9RHOB|nr:Hint domain-containing protein [Parasedimentitalea marina]AZV80920.1 hypothetical protein EBB79_23625 [Parasedimentitalea marina]
MPPIDTTRLDGDPYESIYGIRADTASRGVDLEGARVTVNYADGTSEVLTWEALDPYTNGGASGSGIEMFFGDNWHELSTTKLVASIEIDLTPANSVFDTTTTLDSDPLGGSTPGSKIGYPFELSPENSDLSDDISITYSDIVNLAGSPAAGDLYTTMLIDFSALPGGGFLGDLEWKTDIDTMEDSTQTDLVATNDELTISGDGSETLDVLGNDVHVEGAGLTVTHIDGQLVTAGDTVTLDTGEMVTLNADGTFSISNDSAVDETNTFTYVVADDQGNADVGFVDVTTEVGSPPCFVAGTLIDTKGGPVAVELLEVGTLINTRDHGPQPLRWIGRSFRRAEGRDAPVVFAAGALGDHECIAVSPNHRVLITSERAELLFGQSEVLVKAKHLINDSSIRVQADGQQVTYVHLLFDQHEIVYGNGLESESYHPGAETLDAFDVETRAEILDLMPDRDNYGPTARPALKSHESFLLSGLDR